MVLDKDTEENNFDFDALVDRAKNMQANEGFNLVWSKAFKLSKWHFIAKPAKELNEPRPFIGDAEGKGGFICLQI